MKKTVTKILAILLAAAMLFALSACSKPEEKAEEAVNNLFTSLQKSDLQSADQYLSEPFKGDAESQNMAVEFLQPILEKMSYKVTGVGKFDSGKVDVTVEITAPDMGVVVKDFLVELLSKSISGLLSADGIKEDELKQEGMKILREILAKEDLEMKTTTVQLAVNKTDDGWKIDFENELFDAITGGLSDAFTQISDIFGG